MRQGRRSGKFVALNFTEGGAEEIEVHLQLLAQGFYAQGLLLEIESLLGQVDDALSQSVEMELVLISVWMLGGAGPPLLCLLH